MNPKRLAQAGLVAVALAACQPSGEDRPHMVLGSDLSPLRNAFNRDSGKVRVVMLVAPT